MLKNNSPFKSKDTRFKDVTPMALVLALTTMENRIIGIRELTIFFADI